VDGEHSQSEVVAAILEVVNQSPEKDGTVTTVELCDGLRLGKRMIRGALKKLITEKIIEPCTSVRVSILDNRPHKLNAYRMVKKNEDPD
jgi:hypothetical protein